MYIARRRRRKRRLLYKPHVSRSKVPIKFIISIYYYCRFIALSVYDSCVNVLCAHRDRPKHVTTITIMCRRVRSHRASKVPFRVIIPFISSKGGNGRCDSPLGPRVICVSLRCDHCTGDTSCEPCAINEIKKKKTEIETT